MRRATLISLGLLVAGAAAQAEWTPLPPVSARLSGTFSTALVPALPGVDWNVDLQPSAARMKAKIFFAAAGLKLGARADVARATGDGTWRITAGEFDAAALLAAFAPQLGAAFAGVQVEGRVLVSGEGTLHAGRPTGRLILEWRGGVVRHAAQGWAAQGVAFTGEFALDTTGPEVRISGATPFTLAVRTISTTRFGARNVFLRATLGEGLVLAIATASVELAGGEVVADPFSLPLAPPVIDVNLHLNRIGLQDVAALVPAGLSDARGRVGGEVRLGWSQAGGFRLGAGALTLSADEPATVRLAASPGLLSGNLPERFGFLPESAGVLSRWLSLKNPAFAELQEIELGRTALRVEALHVKLTPETDGRGRTASVEVTARSAKTGGAVDRISFEINVAGPLAAILKVGLNERASLKLK